MNQQPCPSKGQLHQSFVSTCEKCGEMARRILAGERRAPGIAAIIGTANHAAHAKDLTSKMESGSLADGDALDDLVRDSVKNLYDQGVLLSPDERTGGDAKIRGGAQDKAIRMNRVRHTELAPCIQPTALSRKWVCELDGFPYDLAGEFDVEEVNALRDLKNVSRYIKEGEADKSFQLGVYALALKASGKSLPINVGLDFVSDIHWLKGGPRTSIKIQQSTRNEADLVAVMARIERFMEMLEKGVFIPCSPDSWICDASGKWCGFHPAVGGDCKFPLGWKQFAIGGPNE